MTEQFHGKEKEMSPFKIHIKRANSRRGTVDQSEEHCGIISHRGNTQSMHACELPSYRLTKIQEIGWVKT